jgi:glycolate oxidase FAD binding subunit
VSAAVASVEDVREVVAGCPDGTRLLPVAGATKPALSASAREDVEAIDVSGLRGLIDYDPAELTFTALAGTPVAEVAAALAEHGQHLPFDPPLVAAGATLGGVVAAGTSGSGAWRHGGVRDFVIGVRLVDGTGRLVAGGGRVVKNAAGFDLPKLMVGSMGRLGVIAQLSLKVFPRPRATTTLEFTLGSTAAALAAASALVGGPRELDAVDVLPTGRLLVRVGGDADALPARAARVRDAVGADADISDGETEHERWRAAGELEWLDAGATLARVALTARDAVALEAALAPAGASIRFALAGNLAWVGWPGTAPLGHLDAALSSLGLAGMVLIGPADTALLGATSGGAFAERVRRALDPHDRFVEL